MIVLDANILIYAYVQSLPQHEKVAAWLEASLSEHRLSLGIAWPVMTAFLRVSTNRRIFDPPAPAAEVAGRLDELYSYPMVEVISPGEKHWPIYSRLLREMDLSGDVVMDAHIAALAIERNAAVATTDKDFRRFSDHVKIVDPLGK